MTLPTPPTFYSCTSVDKNQLNKQWHHSLSPLSNEYFHPYISLFHHQALDESFLFTQLNNTLFLKDGTLGLLVLISKILKFKKTILSTFAIPLSMAPLIPLEVKKYFIFYNYQNSAEEKCHDRKKLVLFLGAMTPHTSTNKLIEELHPLKGKIEKISILSHNFIHTTHKDLTGNPLNVISFAENYQEIKNMFPGCLIKTISPFESKISTLNLNEYFFVNTNHYQYFCSNDFLSYCYYFKSNISPISFYNKTPSVFTKSDSFYLIKDLIVQKYTYEGPRVISSQELKIITNWNTPGLRTEKKLHKYYTTEFFPLAHKLTNQLFNLNVELRGNFD